MRCATTTHDTITIRYTEDSLDLLGGANLELRLLEFVREVQSDPAESSATYYVEYRCGDGEVLCLHGEREEGGIDIEARLLDENEEVPTHPVRIALELLEVKLGTNAGDPLGLVADYRARHAYNGWQELYTHSHRHAA